MISPLGFKANGAALFVLGGGICVTHSLRFTASTTPADLLVGWAIFFYVPVNKLRWSLKPESEADASLTELCQLSSVTILTLCYEMQIMSKHWYIQNCFTTLFVTLRTVLVVVSMTDNWIFILWENIFCGTQNFLLEHHVFLHKGLFWDRLTSCISRLLCTGGVAPPPHPFSFITASKQSLGKGNVFTPVCLFTGEVSLYDVTFCLAAWSNVLSGSLCLWSHVPLGGVCLWSHAPSGTLLDRDTPDRDPPW